MELNRMRVALDGPSGAGKSTVAKRVAEKTGLIYVDTGALYRAVGLYMADHGIGKDDAASICAALPGVKIDMVYRDGEQVTLLDGVPVENRIRTEQASAYASAVSGVPEVRTFLMDLQRSMAAEGGVIMDGRDIGTVIMPEAEVKVFMTASPLERAYRRYRQQRGSGVTVRFGEVLQNIIDRDRADSGRATAPLCAAPDAVLFVNDGYDVEGSADYVIALMERKRESLS